MCRFPRAKSFSSLLPVGKIRWHSFLQQGRVMASCINLTEPFWAIFHSALLSKQKGEHCWRFRVEVIRFIGAHRNKVLNQYLGTVLYSGSQPEMMVFKNSLVVYPSYPGLFCCHIVVIIKCSGINMVQKNPTDNSHPVPFPLHLLTQSVMPVNPAERYRECM